MQLFGLDAKYVTFEILIAEFALTSYKNATI